MDAIRISKGRKVGLTYDDSELDWAGLGWAVYKITCRKCDDAGSGLDEIFSLGLRDSANVFLNYRLQGFYLLFSHDHQFLSNTHTQSHNYKKSKESKTDLKVIAADIMDDTDLL